MDGIGFGLNRDVLGKDDTEWFSATVLDVVFVHACCCRSTADQSHCCEKRCRRYMGFRSRMYRFHQFGPIWTHVAGRVTFLLFNMFVCNFDEVGQTKAPALVG